MELETILVTGSLGQIGSELVDKLRKIYGKNNVISTDIQENFTDTSGIYEIFDVLNSERLEVLIQKYKVTTVYHLVALLSGTSEKNPKLAWEINTLSLLNILNAAKKHHLKVFFPSSIAVFGHNAEKNFTPQNAIQNPSTVYGISKTAGELWCQYYYTEFNVDVRSLRFPGLISWKTKAGGGTTDYAVNIFYDAIENEKYECYLSENTFLPMLYMDDALNGTIQLMQKKAEKISIRTSYNIGGMSFSPKILIEEIQKHIPHFSVIYKPDFRQKIADNWPNSIDDSIAKKDWNWNPKFDLEKMTTEMIEKLLLKLNIR